MKNPPLLFLDIETLGLEMSDPVWEVAAVRYDENGVMEGKLNVLVKHDHLSNLHLKLPQSFRDDYVLRYEPMKALHQFEVIDELIPMADRATVVGSNVGFDMARLEHMAASIDISDEKDRTLDWHYHPEDAPTLARGWLAGKGIYPSPPWKSDFISRACGVDPADFDRHTAMGDVEWCIALWQKVYYS